MGLAELLEAGLRPQNYVWCKGMPDWQKAEDVPDICRAMRRALAGLDPVTGEERGAAEAVEVAGGEVVTDPQNRREMAEYLRNAFEEAERNARPDFSYPPAGVSVFMAILITLFCFPITGLVAIYFAVKCKSDWGKSMREGIPQQERDNFRRQAHDDARLYRMMVGITFCIGVVMVGMTLSKTLFA